MIEVVPPALNLGPASRTRSSGAAVIGLQDVWGRKLVRYHLHRDTDSLMRDRCVAARRGLGFVLKFRVSAV